jgi:mRNA-degrading endonuclease RelE of RelBE toxin-antitoxin system
VGATHHGLESTGGAHPARLMYRIELTPEAEEDLATLRKFDQRRVIDALEDQLAHEPIRETRNRK